MEKYEGKIVVPGVTAGMVFVYSKQKPNIKRQGCEKPMAEAKRFQMAKQKAVAQLDKLYEKVSEEIDQDTAAIFEVQAMILEDEDYNESILSLILDQGKCAEYAVAMTGDTFSAFFTGMKDEYFRTKSVDIMDVTERLERILTGQEEIQSPKGAPIILVAEDLAPSELIQIERDKLLGLAMQFGSANSHTAIIARVLELPMMIGVEVEKKWHRKAAVLDCEEGILYLEPDLETRKMVELKLKDQYELVRTMKGKATITTSGQKVPLYSWIQEVTDFNKLKNYDGEGVALFKNLFSPFTEEHLYLSYKKMAESRKFQRLLIGIDGAEQMRDRLIIQMKAIIRASTHAKYDIGFCRVTTEERLQELKSILQQAKEELELERIPFQDISIGIMIDTAGEGMMSDLFAKEVEFIGIFLKGLTENMLAVKLTDQEYPEDVAGFYPAVSRLLKLVIENAKQKGSRVILCGQIRKKGRMLEELVSCGMDILCVPPGQVLALRKRISEL